MFLRHSACRRRTGSSCGLILGSRLEDTVIIYTGGGECDVERRPNGSDRWERRLGVRNVPEELVVNIRHVSLTSLPASLIGMGRGIGVTRLPPCIQSASLVFTSTDARF